MDKIELAKILKEHQLWRQDKGGSWADLSGADLSGANLSEANLSEANLSGANLSEADLSWANLSEADLSGANLSEADLSWADLSRADLSWANLSEANLSRANLSRADLSWANLCSPTVFLLCNWGEVSDELCLELMRCDASNHPHPEKFDEWASGGNCPYQGTFARCANFRERRELWKSGKVKSARELVIMLFEEKAIKYKEGI